MNSETPRVHVLPTAAEAGAALARWLGEKLRAGTLHCALAGGSTPEPFYAALSRMSDLPWQQLWIYWSDERCVPPNDPQSNYGHARRHLLTRVHVPKQQIERLRGEVDPEAEARRYGDLLAQRLPQNQGLPSLDLVLLGLGEDGHTASLFPGDDEALASQQACEAVIHPESGQLRLSLTPALINRAGAAAFLVTGANKAHIVRTVLQDEAAHLPAQAISTPERHWFLDAAAAAQL